MSLAYEQAVPGDGDGSSEPTAEIGTIILEAQRFADHTATQARRTADALIRNAQVEAEQILEEARRRGAEEAGRTVEEARRRAAEEASRTPSAPAGEAPVPPEAVSQLVATIDGFARTNRALVEELSFLRQSLAPSAPAPASNGVHAVGATRPAPSAAQATPGPVQVPTPPTPPQHSAPQQPGPAPAYQSAPPRS